MMLCVHVSVCTHVKNEMDSGKLVCCLASTLDKAIVLFLNLSIFLCFRGEENGVVSSHLLCCMEWDSWAGSLGVAAGLAGGQLQGGSCLWQNSPWGLAQPNWWSKLISVLSLHSSPRACPTLFCVSSCNSVAASWAESPLHVRTGLSWERSGEGSKGALFSVTGDSGSV